LSLEGWKWLEVHGLGLVEAHVALELWLLDLVAVVVHVWLVVHGLVV